MTALLDGQLTPVTTEVARAWRTAGLWEGRSLRSVLTETAQAHPDRVALVGRSSTGGRVEVTYGGFDEAAHHAAAVLHGLGVAAGDTVAVMLPNRVEYAEIVFGVNEVGAVYVGIPVAYGELQAAAILRRSRAKILVIPRRWRSNDHLKLSRRLGASIETLEHVLVLDDDGSPLGDGESLWSDHAGTPAVALPEPDPASLCYLGFTSGTTGEPKGAMHSHETLLYGVRAIAAHLDGVLGDPPVQLVASPVGHHTGFHWGVLLSAALGATAVHLDRWEPGLAATVIREERATCFFGAPTFLQDLMTTDLVDDPDCPLTCVVTAGAPIPRSLPAQAGAALGAFVAPAWGMTECGIVSCCSPRDAAGVAGTDGSIFAGSEVRIVDAEGRTVPPGTVGDLLVRGPEVALGYFDRPDATAEAYAAGDLWFATGDTAEVDERGWLSLRGRSKDVIIRGGENIPVTDVESVVFEHSAVSNAALVGVPDPRLGERLCAVVSLRPEAELDLASLSAFLLERGLSKHYLPERLVVLDDLPMTPSGKVQKHKLRDLLRAEKASTP